MEGNARLTSSAGLVLFILLAAEGVTILARRSLLTPHVFIGTLLIPLVLLKIGSTSYRFVRYYVGTSAYRRRGPPHWLLRMIGPVVVVLTVVVIGSGVGLLLATPSLHRAFKAVHRASFFLWFGFMTVHVLGHMQDMIRVGPADWVRDVAPVPGARWRGVLLLASVTVGVLAGTLLAVHVGPYWDSLTFRFDR